MCAACVLSGVFLSMRAEGGDKDDKSGKGDKSGRCMHTRMSTNQQLVEMVAHVPIYTHAICWRDGM